MFYTNTEQFGNLQQIRTLLHFRGNGATCLWCDGKCQTNL